MSPTALMVRNVANDAQQEPRYELLSRERIQTIMQHKEEEYKALRKALQDGTTTEIPEAPLHVGPRVTLRDTLSYHVRCQVARVYSRHDVLTLLDAHEKIVKSQSRARGKILDISYAFRLQRGGPDEGIPEDCASFDGLERGCGSRLLHILSRKPGATNILIIATQVYPSHVSMQSRKSQRLAAILKAAKVLLASYWPVLETVYPPSNHMIVKETGQSLPVASPTANSVVRLTTGEQVAVGTDECDVPSRMETTLAPFQPKEASTFPPEVRSPRTNGHSPRNYTNRTQHEMYQRLQNLFSPESHWPLQPPKSSISAANALSYISVRLPQFADHQRTTAAKYTGSTYSPRAPSKPPIKPSSPVLPTPDYPFQGRSRMVGSRISTVYYIPSSADIATIPFLDSLKVSSLNASSSVKELPYTTSSQGTIDTSFQGFVESGQKVEATSDKLLEKNLLGEFDNTEEPPALRAVAKQLAELYKDIQVKSISGSLDADALKKRFGACQMELRKAYRERTQQLLQYIFPMRSQLCRLAKLKSPHFLIRLTFLCVSTLLSQEKVNWEWVTAKLKPRTNSTNINLRANDPNPYRNLHHNMLTEMIADLDLFVLTKKQLDTIGKLMEEPDFNPKLLIELSPVSCLFLEWVLLTVRSHFLWTAVVASLATVVDNQSARRHKLHPKHQQNHSIPSPTHNSQQLVQQISPPGRFFTPQAFPSDSVFADEPAGTPAPKKPTRFAKSRSPTPGSAVVAPAPWTASPPGSAPGIHSYRKAYTLATAAASSPMSGARTAYATISPSMGRRRELQKMGFRDNDYSHLSQQNDAHSSAVDQTFQTIPRNRFQNRFPRLQPSGRVSSNTKPSQDWN